MISRQIHPRMSNVSDKSCRENQNTILYSITYFFSFENRAVYEIMWENMAQPDSNIIWRMLVTCWITKATDTQSESVIPNAFPG